jgi:hypothetical protein
MSLLSEDFGIDPLGCRFRPSRLLCRTGTSDMSLYGRFTLSLGGEWSPRLKMALEIARLTVVAGFLFWNRAASYWSRRALAFSRFSS